MNPMVSPSRARFVAVPLSLSMLVLTLLTGCIAGNTLNEGLGSFPMGTSAPILYAQTTDSATSGCLRNPACYTHSPGEESVIPWLSRAGDAVRTVTVAMRLLEAAELSRVEEILSRCARQASDEVNNADELLKGRSPDRDECKKIVRQERGRDVTRAMELGDKKHELALACIRGEMAKIFPDNVSVEPRYQLDAAMGKWVRLDPAQVAEWLKIGLTSRLRGSLAPDVVIHGTGNPNQVQRVYDLKFPCPDDNVPSWGGYSPGQTHFPKNQGQMYKDALLQGKGNPRFVTPDGVQ